MGPVEIITPDGMFGAREGEDLIATLMRIIAVGFAEDDSSWPSKYGTDYENDVFLMKRFCWCDREGECPWCTGCGAYEDTCEACLIASDHRIDCYQQELSRRQKAAGLSYMDHEKGEFMFRDGPGDFKRDGEIMEQLAKERSLPHFGMAVHCDCGADKEGERLRSEGHGCDYHHGRGIFARFEPYQHIQDRNYYDPPNFWFKPTDFRLTWYKYIGRDMASNKDELPRDFMEQIFATHPKGMTAEEAVAETQRQEDENAKGLAAMLSSLNTQS